MFVQDLPALTDRWEPMGKDRVSSERDSSHCKAYVRVVFWWCLYLFTGYKPLFLVFLSWGRITYPPFQEPVPSPRYAKVPSSSRQLTSCTVLQPNILFHRYNSGIQNYRVHWPLSENWRAKKSFLVLREIILLPAAGEASREHGHLVLSP